MKLHTWNKKFAALSLIFCLGVAVLTGCGSKAETEESAGAAGTSDSAEAAGDELQEYTVEGVGTFYLPEGFEVESGTSEEGLPMTWANLTKASITVTASRFGADAYEAAGVGLPSSLEEYSQRDGVRAGLPDGAEYVEDDYGNLYVEYTEDGTTVYNVLKLNDEAAGAVSICYPEGDEAPDCGLWASKFILE